MSLQTRCPHQRLEPVDAVDHHGLVVVRLAVERGERLHHRVEAAGQREVRHLDVAEAVFGLDDHRLLGAGGEYGFPNPRDAMGQNPRRRHRGRGFE